MIIRKKQKSKPVIDLDGPDGNAFALLAYAQRWSRDLNFDFTKIKEEMTSGDYENLIQVFDKHFGDYCILERS